MSPAPPASRWSAARFIYSKGSDITPDDIDGSGVEPFATAPVFTATTGGGFFYSLRYLPAGDYTLAVSCSGNDEDPSPTRTCDSAMSST